MLQLIGFDGDDTLWHSEGYYRQANDRFVAMLGQYVDLADERLREQLLATERRNLQLFGYGVKGMMLSMLETAIAVTGGRVSTQDLHRLVALGKELLQHPVELLPGIREAVQALAATHALVLITKGDLFHQERKVLKSGLGDLFSRIEIVSDKTPATYKRVLAACNVEPAGFAMVGNSLRSDIEPVLQLGGWGVYMPYHVTWPHELEHGVTADEPRMLTATVPADIPSALEQLEQRAQRLTP